MVDDVIADFKVGYPPLNCLQSAVYFQIRNVPRQKLHVSITFLSTSGDRAKNYINSTKSAF